MANKDLVVKLTINGNDFDNGLKNAKASMNRFQSDAKTWSASFKSVIGGMTKAFGALGIAVGGAQMFKTFIHSTQTIGDKWDNTMVAAKTSFQTFATAVISGNNDIIRNFRSLISAANEFAEAQDALGSAKISNRYARLTYLNPLNQALANAGEPGISKEQKQAYINEAKGYYQQYANNVNVVKAAAQREVIAWLNKELPGYSFNESNIKPTLDNLYLNLINGVLDPVTKRYKEVTSKEFWKGNALVNSPSERVKSGEALMIGEGYSRQQIAMSRLISKQLEIPDERLNENLDILETEVNATAELIQLQRRINRSMGGTSTTTTVTTTPESRPKIDLIPELTPISAGSDDTTERMEKLRKKLEEMNTVSEETVLINTMMNMVWQNQIDNLNTYGNAIGYLGQTFANLQDIASDDSAWSKFSGTMGGVISQIVSLISTYTALVGIQAVAESIKAGNGIPFPYNLVLIAAAGAALAGIIATIASQTKSQFGGSYEQGGIVPGNSYTGDRLWVRVNSGETILTRKQSAQLFGGGTGGNVHFVIEGSQLRGVLDNYDKTQKL